MPERSQPSPGGASAVAERSSASAESRLAVRLATVPSRAIASAAPAGWPRRASSLAARRSSGSASASRACCVRSVPRPRRAYPATASSLAPRAAASVR